MLTRGRILWYSHRRTSILVLATILLAAVGAGVLLLQKESAAAPEAEQPFEVWARPGSVNLAEAPLPREGALPVRVEAGEVGLSAEVVAVGLNQDGSAEVPASAEQVGWYEPLGTFDPFGSNVLAGHVRYQGEDGAFDVLEELENDDEITVTFDDEGERTYRVVEVASHPKRSAPLAELYDPNGVERLVLITCGGEYDSLVHHYDHNTVVIAMPA